MKQLCSSRKECGSYREGRSEDRESLWCEVYDIRYGFQLRTIHDVERAYTYETKVLDNESTIEMHSGFEIGSLLLNKDLTT